MDGRGRLPCHRQGQNDRLLAVRNGSTGDRRSDPVDAAATSEEEGGARARAGRTLITDVRAGRTGSFPLPARLRASGMELTGRQQRERTVWGPGARLRGHEALVGSRAGFETPRRVALTHEDVSVDPTAQYEQVRRHIERTMEGIEQMCVAAGIRFEDFDLSSRRAMVRLCDTTPAMFADVCSVVAQVHSATLRGLSGGQSIEPKP